MDMDEPHEPKQKRRRDSPFGAAVVNPRDAYKDVPILKQPTWNHEVAAYFFFGGISAGSAVLGAIAGLVGDKKLARTAHVVSFLSLLPCPPLLIDDLGVPSKFYHMLRVFKPSSPMNLGTWALLIHGAGSTLNTMRIFADGDNPIGNLPVVSGILRMLPENIVGALGLPSALTLAGYTGVLIGTSSVPVWYNSPLLGGLFMSSAFGTSLAATSLAASITGQETEQTSAQLTTLGAMAGVTEVAMLAGYAATSGEARQHLMNGQAGMLMAGAVGCLAASALLELASMTMKKRNKVISGIASAAALAGGALLRWGVMKAGKASAADREGTLKATEPRAGSPGWWGDGSR